MPEHIRKMLISMGMKKDATEDEARKFAEDNDIVIREIGGNTVIDLRKRTPGGDTPSPDQIRAGMLEIMQLGEAHNCRKLAETAIGEGISVDEFKCRILETQYKANPAKTAEIGLSRKEVQRFSFCRSILAQITGNWEELAPFEREVSIATAKQMRQNPKGFFIPLDVMGRSLDMSNEDVEQFRDLVAGTPANGGNVIATELLAGDFITMLRANLVLNTLGVTFIPGLVGNIAIPKQTGGVSYYFVGEQEAPEKSTPTFTQLGMTPKTVGGRTVISRQLLMQASIGVEQFVRSEIARAVAEGIEYGVFRGSGSSNQPLGLLNMAINSVAIGANGGYLTGDHIVNMETEVSDDNVVGAMAYLTNARVRGKLKRTQEFDGTNGAPLWKTEKGSQGVGDLNGYPAYIAGTTAIPKTGTKGTGTNLSTMLFGKWSDVIIGLWGVLDMLVDPYSQGDQGDVKVRALQSFDSKLRHEESLCKCTDIQTSTPVTTS